MSVVWENLPELFFKNNWQLVLGIILEILVGEVLGIKVGIFHLYLPKRMVVPKLTNTHWAETRDNYLLAVGRTI